MLQLDRLKILQALADGRLKTGIAAARLGVSARQALGLLRRYQAQGAADLQNRHQGQPGNHELPPDLESRVRGLIRDSYANFGPTLAAEKRRERYGIDLAKETVRRIVVDAGFWVSRKLRPPHIAHCAGCPTEAGGASGSMHSIGVRQIAGCIRAKAKEYSSSPEAWAWIVNSGCPALTWSCRRTCISTPAT